MLFIYSEGSFLTDELNCLYRYFVSKIKGICGIYCCIWF